MFKKEGIKMEIMYEERGPNQRREREIMIIRRSKLREDGDAYI